MRLYTIHGQDRRRLTQQHQEMQTPCIHLGEGGGGGDSLHVGEMHMLTESVGF